jgi:hypothetical protein
MAPHAPPDRRPSTTHVWRAEPHEAHRSAGFTDEASGGGHALLLRLRLT